MFFDVHELYLVLENPLRHQGRRNLRQSPRMDEFGGVGSRQGAMLHRNDVYLPPARGLLIHCECPVAGAGAGVECCWKPGGRPKMLKKT